jgi:sensor histidine kinase YesM
LNVYLSLEKLRFAKDFEYSITYEGSDEISIPSLLIQPFVENAIVHGLMHKKGSKRLRVHFEKNHVITCTIEDNGVGREKAKKITTRRSGEHKSFAMQAINQRLNLLNKQQDSQIGRYEIEDILENGVVAGTRVIVTIPYQDYY